MKRLILALALLLPAAAAWGQGLQANASVEVDYKITKGLHISAGQEIRSNDGLTALGSMRTALGISYKPFKFLKVALGGYLINPFKTGKEITYLDTDGVTELTTSYTGFWAPKYRAYFDVGGYYRLGDFQFSLKERLQLTHNSDANMNEYQSVRNALALKSRLGVKYKGIRWMEPFLAFEMRTALNEPWGTVSGSAQTTKNTKREYYAYTPAGYTHVYNNRYRIALEVSFALSRHHSLTPYFQVDFNNEYVIDTNKAGTRLYSDGTYYDNSVGPCMGLAYTFSF